MFKKGDHVYLIDSNNELNKDIKINTIYWIIEKHRVFKHEKGFVINYTLKDVFFKNIILLDNNVSHLMHRVDKVWIRKLKINKIINNIN